MKRYVVFASGLGYYKSGGSKSLYWGAEDFVSDITDAKWYRKEKTATQQAMGMIIDLKERISNNIGVVVIPIGVEVLPMPDIDVNRLITEKVAEYKELVERLDALPYDEFEDIPDTQYKKYLHGKEYIKAYG